MQNQKFFEKKGPFSIKEIFPNLKKLDQAIIKDVNSLDKASNYDLTFFDSIKYKNNANNTNALYCITTDRLKKYLPQSCAPIIVKSVLFELAKVTKKFYPKADIDYPDMFLKHPVSSNYKNVSFGNNVLIGKNVVLGQNTCVGSNTLIESNVILGDNCIIGSQVIIKNSIIGDNVVIQDGCKIGSKGFGFIPINENNLKFPHIGKVLIEDNVEIANSCTIDRGSIDDTIIGQNTYLDNQVHIAHNVKIGKNCMIAGQVGFAGSTIIGNNVSIGGQAGVSGHLKIGNNVKIGGGSGVINDIPDNQIVMGYPAEELKKFLKKREK